MNAPILNRPPHLTAIGSGKGGTGKTLLAVSLAHALAYEGEKVLLLDADFGLSNTAVHLGLENSGDLLGLLAGTKTLDKAASPVLGGTAARGGFDLLAAPSGSGALADLGEERAARLVAALRGARQYTRILLDLGAGVDATTMHMACAADDTLLILSPDPASLTDAYAFAKLFLRGTGSRIPITLVNMAANESEGRRTADALAATCRAFLHVVPEYLGSVPRDARALEAVRRQTQLLTLYPQSPAARAVCAAAQRLHERLPAAPAPVHAGLR